MPLALAGGPVAVRLAAPAAAAPKPGGGYHDIHDDAVRQPASGLDGAWSEAARAPLRWLRQSSQSFQSLMRLLAERSALRAGYGMPPPLRPKRPRKQPIQVADDPPRPPGYGGEAGGGTDHGARVKEWRIPEDWKIPPAASCRHAGVPVRRGGWYVVQHGDTLWRIAEMHYGYGEAYLRLRRANGGLPDADLIRPCQLLYIPRWRCCGLPESEPREYEGAEGYGRY